MLENGIDMPNVNTIYVLYAQRFGMSALYQLRGRVGRSARQAYAHFMAERPEFETNKEAQQRLNAIKKFTALGSGYELSRLDLEMRGSGNAFGTDQSGDFYFGVDFANKILQNEIVKVRKELILPGETPPL